MREEARLWLGVFALAHHDANNSAAPHAAFLATARQILTLSEPSSTATDQLWLEYRTLIALSSDDASQLDLDPTLPRSPLPTLQRLATDHTARFALTTLITTARHIHPPMAALDRLYSLIRDMDLCKISLTPPESIALVQVWHNAGILTGSSPVSSDPFKNEILPFNNHLQPHHSVVLPTSSDHCMNVSVARTGTGLLESLGWKFASLGSRSCVERLIWQYCTTHAFYPEGYEPDESYSALSSDPIPRQRRDRQHQRVMKVIPHKLLCQFFDMLAQVKSVDFALSLYEAQRKALEFAHVYHPSYLESLKSEEHAQTNPHAKNLQPHESILHSYQHIPFLVYKNVIYLLTQTKSATVAVDRATARKLPTSIHQLVPGVHVEFSFTILDPFTTRRISGPPAPSPFPNNPPFPHIPVAPTKATTSTRKQIPISLPTLPIALHLFHETLACYPPPPPTPTLAASGGPTTPLNHLYNRMVILSCTHNHLPSLHHHLAEMTRLGMDANPAAVAAVAAMHVRQFEETESSGDAVGDLSGGVVEEKWMRTARARKENVESLLRSVYAMDREVTKSKVIESVVRALSGRRQLSGVLAVLRAVEGTGRRGVRVRKECLEMCVVQAARVGRGQVVVELVRRFEAAGGVVGGGLREVVGRCGVVLDVKGEGEGGGEEKGRRRRGEEEGSLFSIIP
ncbi:hypothetical protein HDU98_007364 [Podochytrium sp. JEL0797]|nr:hypothetical protein HDU98_007364 [Podochytrium sp. JEL0797]